MGAEDRAIASAVILREDYSAAELRAWRSKSVNHSRRLLSLAAVRDGIDRGSASKVDAIVDAACAALAKAHRSARNDHRHRKCATRLTAVSRYDPWYYKREAQPQATRTAL
jgi:hypothetical protein